MLFNKLVHTTLAFSVMLVMAVFTGFMPAGHHRPFWSRIILLLCVAVFGHIGKGAQRWLDLGFIKFQPSEFLKIVMPMTSRFMDRHPLPPRLARM